VIKKINIGVIGVGYWGINILRNFNEINECNLLYACDKDSSKLERIAGDKKYRDIIRTNNYNDILKDGSVDAVVVATPVQSHFKLANDVLCSGKDVFVEKPMTYTPKESLELIARAKKEKKLIMVGHTFMFNSAVQEMKKIDIGKLQYMRSIRGNLGPIRQDVNAMYDLATHDIYMFNYFIGKRPTSVFADGRCYIQKDKGIEDIVTLTLDYPHNVLGTITTSWIDPIKTRQMVLVGDNKMILFDDMSINKLEIFKKGVDYQPLNGSLGEFALSYRDGDILQPLIKPSEPLKEECGYFIYCVKTRNKPITDGKAGYDVVAVLNAGQHSLKSGKKELIRYDI
jgi:predicted dehydrogenase